VVDLLTTRSRSPKGNTVSRRYVNSCTATVLAGTLTLAAAPHRALAEDSVTVPVVNGDFSSPAATAGNSTAGHPDWSGGSGAVYSKELADHPGRLQAAALNWNSAAITISTRLWQVRAGATVTVSFDDSPGTYAQCRADQLRNGQSYTVSTRGQNASQTYDTKPTTVGKANWSLGRTYAFTAAENNPLISFTSNESRDNKSCGPLLANVTAKQTPVPVDYEIRNTELPAPEAYDLHSVAEPSVAADECNNNEKNCIFTVDPRYSYQYYDKPRIVGEVYLNCSRNSLQDTRDTKAVERSFDSISQYYAANSKPLDPRVDIWNDKNKPNVAKQVAAGFTKANGNPLAMATNNSLTWTRETPRQFAVTVQPGEVSWIEVQAARERFSGTFTTTNSASKQYRLDATFDTPAMSLSDRFYQRTGPLTPVELARCGSVRPTAVTPDNTARARSSSSRLQAVTAPPQGLTTKRIPLNP
jgi:hypothetical protein